MNAIGFIIMINSPDRMNLDGVQIKYDKMIYSPPLCCLAQRLLYLWAGGEAFEMSLHMHQGETAQQKGEHEMSVDLKALLKELCALRGVSGHEQEVIRAVCKKARAYTRDITVDRSGNVTVHLPSQRQNAPKVVVFGHMDEIGMMVKSIEPDGFLRIDRVGSIHEQIMPGTRMTVHTEAGREITGVVGVRSHHTAKPEEKKAIPEIRELYFDIGADSRAQVEEMGVAPGNILSYAADWIEYPNERVSCKSIDNRVACTIMLGLLDAACAGGWDGPDLYLVFSVQEEFNVRGIMPAIRAIDPDVAIGLDITVTYDTPDSRGLGEVKLGGGPAITYLHFNEGGTLAGLSYNERLNAHLQAAAKAAGVPTQREVCIGVITETSFMTFQGEKGIICGNLSIPTRYTHTPVELISMNDVRGAVALLCRALPGIESADQFALVRQDEIDAL